MHGCCKHKESPQHTQPAAAAAKLRCCCCCWNMKDTQQNITMACEDGTSLTVHSSYTVPERAWHRLIRRCSGRKSWSCGWNTAQLAPQGIPKAIAVLQQQHIPPLSRNTAVGQPANTAASASLRPSSFLAILPVALSWCRRGTPPALCVCDDERQVLLQQGSERCDEMRHAQLSAVFCLVATT